MNIVPAENK